MAPFAATCCPPRPKIPPTTEDFGRQREESFRQKFMERCTNDQHHDRFDYKLRRWKLQESDKPLYQHLSVIHRTPNWQARSSHQRLKLLAQLVPPRVHAAVFGCIWNRWCTLRRFHTSGNCRLCQGRHTEDSIEHYTYCSSVRAIASRRLRLDIGTQVNLHTFTCTNPLIRTESQLIRAALLTYSTYRALNHQRQAASPLLGNDLYQAMCQWLIEEVRGHAKSSHALASVWKKRLLAIQ